MFYFSELNIGAISNRMLLAVFCALRKELKMSSHCIRVICYVKTQFLPEQHISKSGPRSETKALLPQWPELQSKCIVYFYPKTNCIKVQFKSKMM